MKKTLLVLCLIAGWNSTAANAQKWTVYVPAERDFRILFPQPPQRSDEGSGVVAHRTRVDDIEFTVFRHVGSWGPTEDLARVIEKRLIRSQPDPSEHSVRRLYRYESEGVLAPGQYVFRVGKQESFHRVIRSAFGFYELSVRSVERHRVSLHTAQDFFDTFQASATGIFGLMNPVGAAIDLFCKDRADVFSRTFCELRRCFYSGYEKTPLCVALMGG